MNYELRTINPDRLLSTFLSLVQIDSPTGFETTVANWVINYLSSHHISAHIDSQGNVLAHLPGSGQPLLFTAHMDTVEPGRGVRPKITAGVIHSASNSILGADNKAALSAILETLTVLAENRLAHRPLDVIFTVAEESGNLGATNVDLAGITATSGYSFDAAGALGTIITTSPFYNRFDICLIGKSAHAAHPEAAKNVLPVLSQSLSQIKFGRVDSDTVVNIGVISGGSVRNTIPGDLNLAGEVRSFTKQGLESATKFVISSFKTASQASGIEVDVSVITENSGFKLSPTHPAISHASKVLSGLGLTVNLQTTFACFDANVFHGRGITVINLSDGTKNNHTTHESITVSDLHQLAKICLRLLLI